VRFSLAFDREGKYLPGTIGISIWFLSKDWCDAAVAASASAGPIRILQRKGIKSMPQTEYILGHSEREIQRLIHQAAILRPTTERLLREIGLRKGMRVLDLGCGAGDVSMLAAELVGPAGVVIGIDRNPEVLIVARERCREAKLKQVEFKETSLELLADVVPFDAVVGRYVLLHQADPIGFLRAAAAQVRPGGILALHEIGSFGEVAETDSGTPLLRQVRKWLLEFFQSGLPHFDVGQRLVERFYMAELPQPRMFCELPVGGGSDSTLSDWMVETLETTLPQLIKAGVITEEIDIEALRANIADEVREARLQVVGPAQICAWIRV
jgi:ubiquinone/menaquinone biosynthesis C-methylase UbiE